MGWAQFTRTKYRVYGLGPPARQNIINHLYCNVQYLPLGAILIICCSKSNFSLATQRFKYLNCILFQSLLFQIAPRVKLCLFSQLVGSVIYNNAEQAQSKSPLLNVIRTYLTCRVKQALSHLARLSCPAIRPAHILDGLFV